LRRLVAPARGLDRKLTTDGRHQVRPHHVVLHDAGADTFKDFDRLVA
jgi:hypothetical protein